MLYLFFPVRKIFRSNGKNRDGAAWPGLKKGACDQIHYKTLRFLTFLIIEGCPWRRGAAGPRTEKSRHGLDVILSINQLINRRLEQGQIRPVRGLKTITINDSQKIFRSNDFLFERGSGSYALANALHLASHTSADSVQCLQRMF